MPYRTAAKQTPQVPAPVDRVPQIGDYVVTKKGRGIIVRIQQGHYLDLGEVRLSNGDHVLIAFNDRSSIL